ncbi:hypothetical protein GUY61_19970 [Streptomyces sp. GC420]|nr:hypothetical protein [Streptomyces sp. GC420]
MLKRLRRRRRPLDLRLFECSERIGGRLFSVTPPDMPHLHAELGGMRCLDDQPVVADLVDHLGLPTALFPVDEPQNLVHLRQRRFLQSQWDDPQVVPYDLPAAIRGMTPDEARCRSSSASSPAPPPWTTRRGTRSSRQRRPTAGTSTTSGSGTRCSTRSGKRAGRSSTTASATARSWPTSTASRPWRRRWRTSSAPPRRSTGTCPTATRPCPRNSSGGSRRRAGGSISTTRYAGSTGARPTGRRCWSSASPSGPGADRSGSGRATSSWRCPNARSSCWTRTASSSPATSSCPTSAPSSRGRPPSSSSATTGRGGRTSV